MSPQMRLLHWDLLSHMVDTCYFYYRKTSELIPLCHPLPLDQVNVTIEMEDERTAVIRCECRVTHKTGVEMEALTGASIAALTIYDMVKALSHKIQIVETTLVHKSGGKRTVGTDERSQ
jgi:cyclic pyranopterin phosphate synthase